MTSWNPKIEQKRLETALNRNTQNFTGAYMAAGGLNSLLLEYPETAGSETVESLGRVIQETKFSSQRQAFFLYRTAAETLVYLLDKCGNKALTHQIIELLNHIIRTSKGWPHRAASESLAGLPLCVSGPCLNNSSSKKNIPKITWESLIKKQKIRISNPPAWSGRSIIAEIDGTQDLLVVKFARIDDSLQSLEMESVWADYLNTKKYNFSGRFDIPRSVIIKNSRLFQIEKLPLPLAESLYPGLYAIGFIIHREYFEYPNDHRKDSRLDEKNFMEIMFRNARLLGELAAMGIIHTAPVPLFHNRVQRGRREDQGIYQWNRGGRLDQWLFSCRYPNLGKTGIRDFEHLMPLNDSGPSLYHHIGTHLLSLVLITGSYFRNKNPEKIGFMTDGNPVDVRDFFDTALLRKIIQGIFLNYYKGFIGHEYQRAMPLYLDELISRMIDEMGVDNHMEEILRIADQEQMTEEEFIFFLKNRGVKDIEKLKKGEKEISIHTGPHLGGFNQRISLPELIHFLETSSAVCMIHKYQTEHDKAADNSIRAAS